MKLTLDTTNNLKTVVMLDEEIFETHYDNPRDQNVLSAIQQALLEKDLSLDSLSSVSINPGPGSFTGIRVGFAIAQALAYAQGIPLTTTDGSPLEPNYGKPAGITFSSKNS